MSKHKLSPYETRLCGVALSEVEQVRVSLVRYGHHTNGKISLDKDSRDIMKNTYPTRKSFPAAVPSATLVPEKWCTVVFESMA